MKKLYFLLATLFAINIATAQPNIEWQKSLGGTYHDHGYSIQQTTDGGYIVVGNSSSNDGDVTGHHGTITIHDYWVVKLNSSGTIARQKSLGGTNDDFAFSILQTNDGGYIVAGGSMSNDGDVTGNHGYFDYWVVKLNSTGTIAWQKSLGGTDDDFAFSILQTNDGGYIVAGRSESIDGDVTGNHGYDDYWIVKLNSTGTIQWQKSLGGTNYDGANSIQQTTDGGYIVAGGSMSNDGDVTGNHGSNDYWVVKLNSIGTIQWQKSLGGTFNDIASSIRQTTDGGFIVDGGSRSNDGDITGHHGTNGYYDYWIVKLNSTGAIDWQKSLGGTYDENANSIQQTSDGGYIVAGVSNSNDGDVSGHHGSTTFEDYWVVKLSPEIGVNELSKNNRNLSVYPNPANNLITVRTNAIKKGQLTIISINGQEVKKLMLSANDLQIDVNDLPGGVYFIKVLSEQGISIAKFVKE